MTHDNLQVLCKEVLVLAREVAVFIKGEIDNVTQADIETKDLNSLVSYVDKTAEERLVAGLSKLLPDSGFITEEKTTLQDSSHEYTWIIDPLDGTTNYLKRIPHYSTSIALTYQGNLVLGVVSDISQDTYYHAIKDGGAYCNGSRIKTSKVSKLNEAIVVTGFPYNRKAEFDDLMNTLAYFLKQSRGIRRLGSAALDLAYVASGRLDAYYETSLNIWDVAAGILLVKEAGGTVTDFSGGGDSLDKAEVVVSNPALHPEVLAGIKQSFLSNSDYDI